MTKTGPHILTRLLRKSFTMTATRPDLQRSGATFDASIGITERVTQPATFWQGIMRHRRTDFLVNEIQKDGTVLHLRNCNIEPPKEDKPKAAPATPAPGEEKADIPQEDIDALEALTSKSFTEQLVRLYKTGSASADASKPCSSVSSDIIDDKPRRSKIHQEVRRIFDSEIDTTTNTTTGSIVASKRRSPRTRNKNAAARNRTRVDCPGTGDFLHFTLFKENRDTLEAVNLLSRMLSLKARSVHFAGTKDRRAATVQRCSVRLRTANDLARLNPRLYGIKTGDYEYRADPVRLGQLRGNEFVITVKDCRLASDAADLPAAERAERLRASLAATVENMAARGWINYFGHQRFGSFATGTHKVGMLIFSGRLKDAVDALLRHDPKVLEDPPPEDLPRSSPRHDEYNRALGCHIFKTEGDAAKALRHIPPRYSAESTIIGHLGRPGSAADYAGALLHLPRGLRTLYLHAYQSYVWNHAASRRWELYGSAVVKGDLVAEEKPAAATAESAGQEDGAAAVAEEIEDSDDADVSARVLSDEDVASGKYTIDDVLLPTAGTDTLLPDNEVGAFYRAFMLRPENGGLDPLDLPKAHKEFTAAGRYRKLVARFLAPPSVSVRRYASDDEQMWPTDLDVLERAAAEKRAAAAGERRAKRGLEEGAGGDGEDEGPAPSKKARVDGGGAEGAEEASKVDAAEAQPGPSSDVADGEKVAAVLHFQLGRSAYATVVMREMGLAPEE